MPGVQSRLRALGLPVVAADAHLHAASIDQVRRYVPPPSEIPVARRPPWSPSRGSDWDAWDEDRDEDEQPKAKPQAKTPQGQVILDRQPHTSVNEAEANARLWVAACHVTPEELRGWLGLGFQLTEWKLVQELKAHGVTPESMSARVNGEMPMDKLRLHRYGIENLAEALRRAGRL